MPRFTGKPKKPRGAYCPSCSGHRLHEVISLRDASGKVTRTLVCTVCGVVTRLGISCPKCGECRMRVTKTFHRGEVTIREKRCRSCPHRIRTREIVESFAS